MASIFEGNAVKLIAPVGGVTLGNTHVINNRFVVARQTQAAGSRLTTGVIWLLGKRED